MNTLAVDVEWAGGAVPGWVDSGRGLSRMLGVRGRVELTVCGARDKGGCLTGGTFAMGMVVAVVVTDDKAAERAAEEDDGIVMPLLVFNGFVTRLCGVTEELEV